MSDCLGVLLAGPSAKPEKYSQGHLFSETTTIHGGIPPDQPGGKLIDAQHRATLDLDNELTQKTAFATSIFRDLNLGFGLEQPFLWKGGVKMFDLQPFQELVALGAETVIFDQCEYKVVTVKPT